MESGAEKHLVSTHQYVNWLGVVRLKTTHWSEGNTTATSTGCPGSDVERDSMRPRVGTKSNGCLKNAKSNGSSETA